MTHSHLRLPLLLAGIALASAAPSSSTNVIVSPPPYWNDPQPLVATVVVQDTASWLVTEFTGPIGCSGIKVDSLRFDGASHLNVRWTEQLVKLDSAAAIRCQDVARFRRIDRLPARWVATSPDTMVLRAPDAPDSATYCYRGPCRTLPVRKVQTPSAHSPRCLVGVPPAFASHEQAVSFLRHKSDGARALLRLNRLIVMNVDYLVAKADFASAVNTESIVRCPDLRGVVWYDMPTAFPGWGQGYLAQVNSWNDPRVPANFALPSPGNASDLYGEESLEFRVDTLPASSSWTSFSSWSYKTGRKGYLYQGSGTQYSKCGTIASTGPAIFADTLATDGVGLLVNNEQPACPRQDVDAFAGNGLEWLVMLPLTGEPLDVVFRHYASAETSWSWPIEGDSVLVRGQKVALDELQGASGVADRGRRSSGLRVGLSGHVLTLRLDQADQARVMDASGRVLVSQEMPKGSSTMGLPRGVRGLLVVQVGSRRQTVMVP